MIELGYIWLIVALFLLFLEAGTPGLFFFLSFAVGAACASLCSFLGASIYLQCSIAILTTAVALVVIKYYTGKHKMTTLPTNVYALIGREGIIVQAIEDQQPGRVRVGGETWPAITEEKTGIAEGVTVRIIGIQGNKLIVQ